MCLITIGVWIIIELFVQFFLPRYGGSYSAAEPARPSYRWKHSCIGGLGMLVPPYGSPLSLLTMPSSRLCHITCDFTNISRN